MTTPPTAPSSDLADLFDEHADPTHISCAGCHAAVAPTAELVLSIQQQIAEYRKKLATLQLSPHDTAIDGKLELLHQTLTVMESSATTLYQSVRRLAGAAAQWDRVMADAKTDVARWQAQKT